MSVSLDLTDNNVFKCNICIGSTDLGRTNHKFIVDLGIGHKIDGKLHPLPLILICVAVGVNHLIIAAARIFNVQIHNF